MKGQMKEDTVKVVEFLKEKELLGYSISEMVESLEYELNIVKTYEAVRKLRTKYVITSLTSKDFSLKLLASTKRNQNSNSLLRKTNKALVDDYLTYKNIEDSLKLLVTKKLKPLKARKKQKTLKNKVILEAVVSDIHYGKLVELKGKRLFDFEIVRKRMNNYALALVEKVKELEKLGNSVQEIHVQLIGDIIENATIHGAESLKGCEGSNPSQVANAINSIFEDFLRPLAELNIKTVVNCVPGNHDRDDIQRTYQNPGINSWSWVIYKGLEKLCEIAKFKTFSFVIPTGIIIVDKIFNLNILLEHGDNVKNLSEPVLESHILKRGQQENILFDGLRLGHYHKPIMFGLGRIIVNGSVCGEDSYSNINGYNSVSCQVVNIYQNGKFKYTEVVKLEE